MIVQGTSLIGHAFLSNFEFCLKNVNFTDGIDVIDVAYRSALQWQILIWKNNPHKSKQTWNFASLQTPLLTALFGHKKAHEKDTHGLINLHTLHTVLMGKNTTQIVAPTPEAFKNG